MVELYMYIKEITKRFQNVQDICDLYLRPKKKGHLMGVKVSLKFITLTEIVKGSSCQVLQSWSEMAEMF